MIIDNFLTFSGTVSGNTWTGQTVTGTGNVISTNVLDTNPTTTGPGANQPSGLGGGEDLIFAFEVGTSFAGATSVECQVISSDDSASSVNVNVLGSTGAIPIANLTAGRQFALKYPRSAPYPIRRFIAIRYVIVGSGSAGTMICNLVKDYGDVQNQYYRSGFAVS